MTSSLKLSPVIFRRSSLCRTLLRKGTYHNVIVKYDQSMAFPDYQRFSRCSTNSQWKTPSSQWTPDISSRGFARVPSPTNQDSSSTADIVSFLKRQGVKYIDGHTCFSMTCPRFKNLKADADRLFVNKTTGHFVCRSCKKSGKWSQLRDNIAVIVKERTDKKKRPQACFKELEPDSIPSKTAEKIQAVLSDSKSFQECDEATQSELMRRFNMEGLLPSCLDKYQVRVSRDLGSLIFPFHNSDGSHQGLKLIKVHEDEGPNKFIQHFVPRSDRMFLFGWATVSTKHKMVVVTTSETDAIAVHQATKIPAVALSKGQSALPPEVLPFLEQFDKIILWFGSDVRNWDAAKMFAKKLGEERCHLVSPSDDQPNAMEALRKNLKLSKIASDAKPAPHKSITSFKELRQEVFNQFSHAEQAAGVKWKRYPRLNQLLKGHRRGELTVFTGPTGSGKTTFISDYSLDLCLQGVHTLWGSFEINNVRLCRMMLQQFARKNVYKNLDNFDEYADGFEAIPMHFMTFHGEENFKKVLDTMSHAVYVHDIAHVIVDNLQFMMGVERFGSSMDRFFQQEVIIGAFRRFATNLNCHVTLVIHPRKEDDESLLSKSSIFGTAKASQEADNILILQDQTRSLTGKKFIQVVKNRYDGECGSLILKFDKESLGFAGSESKPKTRKKANNDGDVEADNTVPEL
ncbi:twinkle mtDNA helicase-like [Lineus longissimus]|uniref:twinkle mtDNA helicase-like n=1 Tax=Lineus longissimus TaxID=88925 RepID=UPI00315CE262